MKTMYTTDKIRQRFRLKASGTQYRTLWQVLHLDPFLLLSLLALITFGFFILYSASNQNFDIILQEIIHISFALLLMFIIAQLHPSIYQRWSPWLFGVGTLLLITVLIIGHINKGAQRWLSLGFLHFQPSEIMKLAIPMILAWFYTYRPLPPKTKDLLLSTLIILIPVMLTIKEPDLGTAVILAIGGSCILFLAGMRWRLIFLLILLMLIAAPIMWHFLHGYQQQRLLTFFNPERDPLGAGYHIIQSKIAIGSGGILGKGWLQGTQSHLHFLPEHSTDFIFAVCGEEFGLLGSITLLLIYLCIIARCIYITMRSQNTYTRLLSGSLTLMFFFSVFINLGMVCGILPVVGIPLPLISYGGSSMITTMASFGILMSIHGHRNLLSQ